MFNGEHFNQLGLRWKTIRQSVGFDTPIIKQRFTNRKASIGESFSGESIYSLNAFSSTFAMR